MSTDPRRRSPRSPLGRWVRGLLPPAGGGLPPALVAARAQLSGWLIAAIALVAGAVVGLVLVVVTTAMPRALSSVGGLAVGAALGAAVALTLASRYPRVRRMGGVAILLAPFLLLAAPFLLIAVAVALLRGSTPRGARTSPAAPTDEITPVVVARARRVRRKRSAG